MFYLLFTILLAVPIGSYSQYWQNLPLTFQTEWVISKKAPKKKAYNYYNCWKRKRNCNSFYANYNSNIYIAVSDIETKIIINNQEEIFKNIEDHIVIAVRHQSEFKEEYEGIV